MRGRAGVSSPPQLAFVLAAGAAAFSAAMLVRPAPHAVHTVIVPPTAPTYSAADASAAKSRACAAWEVTSATMAQASQKRRHRTVRLGRPPDEGRARVRGADSTG